MSESTAGAYVYLTDVYGYDARGGNAEVFATLEAAKKSLSHVTSWKHNLCDEGHESWDEVVAGLGDMYVITKVRVQG